MPLRRQKVYGWGEGGTVWALMRGVILILSVAKEGPLNSAHWPTVRTVGRLEGENP